VSCGTGTPFDTCTPFDTHPPVVTHVVGAGMPSNCHETAMKTAPRCHRRLPTV